MRNQSYFITATNTEVGKTYISALLVKAFREKGIDAGYFKPALSDAVFENGTLVPGDAAYVCQVAGLEVEPETLVSHIYSTPVAPHLAARLEGKDEVSLEKIMRDFSRHQNEHEMLIVEGCGGIICPLRDEPPLMLEDVMTSLALPLIVVSGSGLGSINSCFLTIEYAKRRGLDVAGVIMNDYDSSNFLHEDNAHQIERLTGVRIIARVAHNDMTIKLDDLLQE